MERSAETTRDDPDGEYLKRYRWFESGSLQRGVYCEPVRAGGYRLIAAGGEDAEGSLSDSRSACRRRIALILDIGGRRQADLGVRSLALLASLSLG